MPFLSLPAGMWTFNLRVLYRSCDYSANEETNDLPSFGRGLRAAGGGYRHHQPGISPNTVFYAAGDRGVCLFLAREQGREEGARRG